MNFTSIFIKRPVLATCVSLLLLAAGLIAFQKLTLREFPKVDANVISVETTYQGANANVIESFITTPIENAIAGVDGIDFITSESKDGKSIVTINLNLNVDVDSALTDVQSDISSVLKKLPSGIDNPIVRKMDPDGMPSMIIVFSGAHYSPAEITDYITRSVQPILSNLTGVGSADILGNRTYAMRIWLDNMKMAQYGVTAADISKALQDNNLQAEAGEIDRNSQKITINAATDLTTAEQFSDLVIKQKSNRAVRLRDIGRVELGNSDDSVTLMVDGKSGVGVGISVKSTANPLDVAKLVKQAVKQIDRNLPSGMHVRIARDNSTYISKSLYEVNSSIIEASIFVILVIYLFIGSIRSVFIPLVTIPLSLVGACLFMYIAGYTINTLTLLAFVLAIGMVVDDAIVVLENVYRYIEEGLSPFAAAIKGAKEISFAVIAMTITLAAVYAPLGFTGGLTGALFKEFAFTLAGTVVISGFIALTLSPMMCSKIMRPMDNSRGFQAKVEHVLTQLSNRYANALSQVLAHRKLVVIALFTVLICGTIVFIPLYLTSNLAPTEDQGIIFAIGNGPSSANVSYTQKYTEQLREVLNKVPEKNTFIAINGRPTENKAMAFIGLKDWDKRSRSAEQIIGALSPAAAAIPGLQFLLVNPSSLPGARGFYPMKFVIKTNKSYQDLDKYVQKFIMEAGKNRGFLRVQSDLKLDKPEISISVHRNKAAELGVSMADITEALKVAFGKAKLSTFVRDGMTYDVISQVQASDRINPHNIDNVNVRTSSGKTIPLSNLVTLSDQVMPSSLNHFQQQRAAMLNIVTSPLYSTQAGIDYLESLAKKILPDGMSIDFSGQTRQYIQTSSELAVTFLFSLIFIYIVLSAQFESFIDPLIVLFSVPMSLIGAMIALFFTGGSLNIYTEIGLITLVGLIAKHGILIVEFANQQCAAGAEIKEAIVKAAGIRLRPILMTTAAMVLGALPLILASGAGAEARQQMGIVIAGGMSFGTLLTLFVVPTMYTFLSKHRKQ